jgi:hypothetical protein
MGKLVLLTLYGNFDQGFITRIQIGEDGKYPERVINSHLPPFPEIPKLYEKWQLMYQRLSFENRIKAIRLNVIHCSASEVTELSQQLGKCLNEWLVSPRFADVIKNLYIRLNVEEEVRFIIESDNTYVPKLPWHLWDLSQEFYRMEISFSLLEYSLTKRNITNRRKIRILSILASSVLANSFKIDIDQDRKLLESLSHVNAEILFMLNPTRPELNEKLWDQKGWDILCFSGHSASTIDSDDGWININDKDKLKIADLKYALSAAIKNGLQIAIFNSCDGLGLANQLANLNIPEIIFMREPVPDIVAQEFLKNFLTAFASGKSFYLAVREAREKLQGLEDIYPCASWLPVICQNPAEIPPTWESLQGIYS